MSKVLKINLLLLLALSFFSCGGLAQKDSEDSTPIKDSSLRSEKEERKMTPAHAKPIIVGAERMLSYVPSLTNKRVAVVANATSMVSNVHLIDTLLASAVDVKKVFAPEHGFRGTADAGEKVQDERDSRTGLPIISLYGKNKKPSPEVLKEIDLLIFDIQDVGVRCYTYISTLHHVLEACAENGVEVLVLDRPNPNGFYVDGPMLKDGFESFVGMHPVPLIHGLTIGEYAQMIVGEAWIESAEKCVLSVVTCAGYSHSSIYELPVRPSPNLPNASSIYLYPSLVLFEGTSVSVGRGTDKPFQVVGHPDFTSGTYSFTPAPNLGAKYPKLEGKECKGMDLSRYGEFYSRQSSQMSLQWLLEFYKEMPDKDNFFLENGFFNTLAGSDELMTQIKNGMSEKEIRASWQEGLDEFKQRRAKYLLYE